MGDCLIQVWLYAFSSSITTMQHWYYSLYYLGKKWSPTSCPAIEAAVFGVWLITRKLISRKFSHNCGYYVTAKEAVVTSTTISYKIKEMHDSFKFKCKRATVRQENDKGGKNLQLLVVVPKEILESSDLIAQVYFPIISHLYLSFYGHYALIMCSFMDSELTFLLFKLMIDNTSNFR